MPAYITPGETFTGVAPGKSVTPTRLNNHVAGLTILPAFIDTQPALTGANATLANDKVLVFDASANALVSMTLTQFYAAQVVDAAPATGSLRTVGTSANSSAPGNFRALENVFTGTHQQFKHVVSTGGASIAANAAGLGTGGTPGASAVLGAGSGDLAGRITLTSGATGMGTIAIAAVVSFAVAYTNAPWVFLLPYGFNAWAAQAGNRALTISASTVNDFTITTGTLALAANTAVNYAYLVISGA